MDSVSESDSCEIPLGESRSSISKMTQTDIKGCDSCDEGPNCLQNFSGYFGDMSSRWKNHFMPVCPVCSPAFGLCPLHNLRSVYHVSIPYYPFQPFNTYMPFNLASPGPPPSVIPVPMLMSSFANVPPVTCHSECPPRLAPEEPGPIQMVDEGKKTTIERCYKSSDDKCIGKSNKIRLFKRLEQKYLKNKVSNLKTSKCYSADGFLNADSSSCNSWNRRSMEQGSSLSFPLTTDKIKMASRQLKSRFSTGTDVLENRIHYRSSPVSEDSISMRSEYNYVKKHPIMKGGVSNNSINEGVSDKGENVKKTEVAKNMHELANLLCDFNVKDEDESNELYADIIRKTIDSALRENSEQMDALMMQQNLKSDSGKVSRNLSSLDKDVVRDLKVQEEPSVVQKRKNMETLFSKDNEDYLCSSLSNTSSKINDCSGENYFVNRDLKKYRSRSDCKINELRDMTVVSETNLECYVKDQAKSSKLELKRSLSNTSTVRSRDSVRNQINNFNRSYSGDAFKIQSASAGSSAERLQPEGRNVEFKSSIGDIVKQCEVIKQPKSVSSGNFLNDQNSYKSLSSHKFDNIDKYQSNVHDLCRADGSSNSDMSINKCVQFDSGNSNENLMLSNDVDQIDVKQMLNDVSIDVSSNKNVSEDINRIFENITAHFIIPNCDEGLVECDDGGKSTVRDNKFTEISFSVNYDPNNPELVMVDCAQKGKDGSTVDSESCSNNGYDRAKDFTELIKNIVDTNFYTQEPTCDNWREQENEDMSLLEAEEFGDYNLGNQLDLSTQSAKKRVNKVSQYSLLQNMETLSIISEGDEEESSTSFKTTTTSSSYTGSMTEGPLPPDTNVFGSRIELMNILHSPCEMCDDRFTFDRM